jgi:hypothetical protein
MWQDIIVGACVLAAAVFVLRQWLPLGLKTALGGSKKTTGCGGCGGCDTSPSCNNPSEK